MDSSKEHKYTDPWKKAFKQADITPPEKVWDNIERVLDQEKRVTPLWWHIPKLWYAAASMVGLLLAGAWLYQVNLNEADLLTNTSSGKAKGIRNEAILVPQVAITSSSEGQGKVALREKESFNNKANDDTKDSFEGYTPLQRSTQVRHNEVLVSKSVKDLEGHNNPIDLPTGEINLTKNEVVISQAHTQDLEMNLPLLTPITPQLAAIYVQKRFVFYKSEDVFLEEVNPSENKSKEYWVGVGFAPGIFNPNVNIKSSPQMFSSAFSGSTNARGTAPSVGKSKPDLSFSFQTQGGVRLSKHWSIESGIGYLQGNSQYEGGGYLLNVATSGSVNVLESAIHDANKSPAIKPLVDDSKSSVHVDINNTVRNNYQYVQVPLQAGFTLNPDGKLSYAVLGGVTANVFLNNQIESANGKVTKTTVADDIYRPLGVGASTGLRLNYQVSDKWKATLTGTYLQSLSSGFKTNQQLESHPYMYGVSWGVRYSF